MEDDERPLPVTVEGPWDPDQARAGSVWNKLQLYFQSKRKSGGGECRVEAEDGGPRAAVFFRCEQVKQRVLARENHEILLNNQTVKLRLTSASIPTSSDDASGPKPQESEVEPGEEASAENRDGSACAQSVSVVLDNVPDNMPDDASRDLLSMLVENISGLDHHSFSLEIIWESSRAVVSFKQPADAERFLAMSRSTQKLQQRGLTARPLEAAASVRVESIPPTVVKDMLELFFEKHWVLPDDVVMIPSEHAAVVSFRSPEVVQSICTKEDYEMRSIPLKVYPYYESLGTALYGAKRPKWKMPEPFAECVHHSVWKFLLMKKLLNSLNDQMRPYFCSVDLEHPEVKLHPLPGFLRQKGLTAQQVDEWTSVAKEAFRRQMSEYSAFDCPVNAHAWKAAEKDVRSAVRDDAVLVLDTSKGILTVAGRADDLKQIRVSVENIVLKAMDQVKRQTEGLSDVMNMSPAMFYILNHEGFQKAAQDISPDIKLSFDEGNQELTLTGLPAEVYQTKAWILERKGGMSKKHLNIPRALLDFLKTVDPMDMSQHLFTSKGIGAVYAIESKGLVLSGSSESVLMAAESKMKADLAHQILDVEDQEVLKLHLWVKLNQQLLDTYNSSTRKTVTIHVHLERKDKVTVAGFPNQVKEVGGSLREFIMNYSRVQETIRVKSCAVVQFIEKNKSQDWSGIAKDNDVEVRFDSERPKITLAGARLHVQKAKSCFQELTSALSTDHFMVDKPGAKKFFLSQGSQFLSTIMTELSCVVVLCPENQEEEEEEEVKDGHCYCKVKTASGVLVLVSKDDICRLGVDAVVNAANEDLQHIGGLALALLNAAGPELQKISNDHVARRGKLRVGEAVVTAACNLPCGHVVHAVGPRFSDADRKTSVSRLKLAVQSSLTQAEAVNCSTVALPAISSGVFGFPVDLCAETIAQAVRDFCDAPRSPRSLTEVHLVDNNDHTVRVLAAAVNKLFMDLGPTMTVPPPPAAGRGAGASGGYQLVQNQSPRGRPFGQGQGTWRGPQGAHGTWGGPNLGGNASPGGHGGSGRVEQTTAEGMKITLRSGNIQDQTTDVIVNTISGDLNLRQGAVSGAVLQGAGPRLQPALRAAAEALVLPYGDVVVTDGFNLKCRKVFHAVCPYWDNEGGQAEEELVSIVRRCLQEAERHKMASLSFPAIGTGNLRFPRDVVSRVLLQEIHAHSRRAPGRLREVAVVVHPSDAQTADCFTREFKGQTGQRNVQREAREFTQPPVRQSVSQSQQPSASFGPVASPALGVHRMQMGPLSLEVSTGDITKEACEVIVNSSNQNFTLKSGVSKAILDSAGLMVQLECSQIVGSKGFQPVPFILTSAGLLPSSHILHVVGINDAQRIRELVYSVLKFCEENKFRSVAFPALGTGQGGAPPAAVADAMVEAVVDFVRKKHPRFVLSVKVLIFQTLMMADFLKSMKRREGEEVEGKRGLAWLKESVTSFFLGVGDERPATEGPVLEREEFEPTAFQLCADSDAAVSQARRRITELIVTEQFQRTISNPFISKLSQDDVDQLRALQRKLTVSIHLNRGPEHREPNIHLEGLTRDVLTAEAAVREMIHAVERAEHLKSRALLLSSLVEWQHRDRAGVLKPFDLVTNLQLEEALERKQPSLKIKIHHDTFTAHVAERRAVGSKGELELLRRELRDALPPHWDAMTDLLQLFPLSAQSKEHQEVEAELTKTGLSVGIVSIERVQNVTLWQSFQLMKKQLEVKNKHTNNERRLFHGTDAAAVDLINKQGFNRSYAGAHGAMLGNGSYFAVDPVYSAQRYAPADGSGHKRVYLSRVLVGDFTKGKPGLITPPCKASGNAADLYDSVADQTQRPTMFVVFSDMQAYPEYLIVFT